MTKTGGVYKRKETISFGRHLQTYDDITHNTLSSRGLRGTLYSTQLINRRFLVNAPLHAQLEIQGPSEASG